MVKIFNFDDHPTQCSANTYVIGKVGGNCIVVDIGSTSDEIYHYIDKHYEKVVAVLLTHAHFDHIRGLTKLLKHYRNRYDIPVYLSEEDVPLLPDPKINSSFLLNESVQVNVTTTPVKDGDILNIKDFKIKVIHTPFHTKGSVCYLFEDDNALFTGDTLFKGGIGRTDLPYSEPEKVKESLMKITALPETLVIYPGHGPISRIEIEKKNNPYLR